jgi:hypothetical protein
VGLEKKKRKRLTLLLISILIGPGPLPPLAKLEELSVVRTRKDDNTVEPVLGSTMSTSTSPSLGLLVGDVSLPSHHWEKKKKRKKKKSEREKKKTTTTTKTKKNSHKKRNSQSTRCEWHSSPSHHAGWLVLI